MPHKPQPTGIRVPPKAPPPIGVAFGPGPADNGDESDEEARRILLDKDLAILDLALLRIRAMQSEYHMLIRDSFPAQFDQIGTPDGALLEVLRNLKSLDRSTLSGLQVAVKLRADIAEEWARLETDVLSNPSVRAAIAEPMLFGDAYGYVGKLFKMVESLILSEVTKK